MTTKSPYERQLDLERDAILEGQERYRKQNSKSLANSAGGRTLLKRLIESAVDDLENFIRERKDTQKAKRWLDEKLISTLQRSTSVHILHSGVEKKEEKRKRYFGLKFIDQCYLALNEVLRLQVGETRTKLARRIASALVTEFEMRKFSASYPKYFKKLVDDLTEKSEQYYHKERVLLDKKRDMGLSSFVLTTNEEMVLGNVFINIFCESGIIESVTVGAGRNKVVNVQFTEKILEAIDSINTLLESRVCKNYPMLCQPLPWTSVESGGYLTQHISNTNPFIRYKGLKHKKDLAKLDIPQEVFDAVNRIQNVPWRVSKKVLEVAKELEGTGRAGLLRPPEDVKDDLPAKPWPQGCFKEWREVEGNSKVYKDWKNACADMYKDYKTKKSKVLATRFQLTAATKFQDEVELYFPHNLDYRGRIYPIPDTLNPQQDDLGKSLLEFKNSHNMGGGLDAFLIHGANKFGLDKQSLTQRINWAWSEDTKSRVKKISEDPIEYLELWEDTDSPWCFLAWCFEYDSYLTDPENFRTHLPIAIDGTCNGLQHFAGLLKDEVGAKTVNLVDADKPQDVYELVANSAKDILKSYEDSDDVHERVHSAFWRVQIDRGLVKRPVMTTPYAVTWRGKRDQMRDEVSKNPKKYKKPSWDAHNKSYQILTNVVSEAILVNVPSAVKALDWFKQCAGVLAEANLLPFWKSSIGFPVLQTYYKGKTKRVDTTMRGGVRLRSRYNVDTDTIDKKRSMAGIAPNYIHSQDAAHLMKTVNKLVDDQSISDFSFIHDSFATHADNVDILHKVLRECFCDMYDGLALEPLESFRRDLEKQLIKAHREDLIEKLDYVCPDTSKSLRVPLKGNLEVSESVLRSTYFFN